MSATKKMSRSPTSRTGSPSSGRYFGSAARPLAWNILRHGQFPQLAGYIMDISWIIIVYLPMRLPMLTCSKGRCSVCGGRFPREMEKYWKWTGQESQCKKMTRTCNHTCDWKTCADSAHAAHAQTYAHSSGCECRETNHRQPQIEHKWIQMDWKNILPQLEIYCWVA